MEDYRCLASFFIGGSLCPCTPAGKHSLERFSWIKMDLISAISIPQFYGNINREALYAINDERHSDVPLNIMVSQSVRSLHETTTH